MKHLYLKKKNWYFKNVFNIQQLNFGFPYKKKNLKTSNHTRKKFKYFHISRYLAYLKRELNSTKMSCYIRIRKL